ncbi:HAD superfamily hydrolase (TIGR01509 family) [Deinobacterium chartae]|uniref:HAD superfamily hydrolase (TIGR01509 family) n=1 Tax=Deinobacterium chartae TaxID=521158 RepID=A0A841HYK1_9DEIO|nr:HAD superfamily hydrolase (TIGR01509 family) [Deinobacterium chartae]
MRAITFDWGGVFTLGTFDGRATARVAERYGLDLEQVRVSYFRHIHRLEVGEWSLPQFWEVFAAEIGAQAPYAEFEELYLGSVLENPAMYDFLPTISPEYRVGLLSNNYPVVSDHLKKDPRWARFDAMVFSNEIGHKKPAPEAFLALAELLGVEPAQAVFVDDVQENLDAASQLGFATILYTTHERFLEDLAAWEHSSSSAAPQEEAGQHAVRLLQGYLWHPKEAGFELAQYLPAELEGAHLLWDEVRPPFAFFENGELTAGQTFYQFTVVDLWDRKPSNDESHARAEAVSRALEPLLEATPPGVGWQLMEDLRFL